MKKNILPLDLRKGLMLLLVSNLFFFVSSCSNDDPTSPSPPDRVVSTSEYKCATCKTSPEALAINDNSSKGIYIGFTESGILSIDIDNKNMGETKASLLKNNIERELVFLESHSDSERYYALFADNVGTPISLMFSVMLNGDDPQITLKDEVVFKTNNSLNALYKERSYEMIEVFEGDLIKETVIGHELIVVSRSRAYWSEMRSYYNVGFQESQDISFKNNGVIIGKNLIYNESNENGSLNSDLISGMVYSESGDLWIELKRVL